jgi:transposase-like protein
MKKRTRRKLTVEFKHETTSPLLDKDYSAAEAARSLDINDSLLRRWVKQLSNEQGNSAPIERVFRSLKSEWAPSIGYSSITHTEKDISAYLMGYYKTESALTAVMAACRPLLWKKGLKKGLKSVRKYLNTTLLTLFYLLHYS